MFLKYLIYYNPLRIEGHSIMKGVRLFQVKQWKNSLRQNRYEFINPKY